MQKKITIGVSKLAANYSLWLNKLHNDLEIIDYYTLPVEVALKHAAIASGILLPGGSDIHPGLYGRDEDVMYCKNIDTRRDTLEIEIIELAFRNNIPVLGICRGQQILNIAGKGTLYADIPIYINTRILHADIEDVFHGVVIEKDSILFKLTGINEGTVNSAHHQVINLLTPGFRASAFSSDGLIEAIETDSTVSHPFCVAVQWHPERMDIENPLSGLLGRGFIEAAGKR